MSMRKIMLIGANGQLGVDLQQIFQAAGDIVLPFTHAQLEIGNGPQVATILAAASPDVVINTAAFHKVEECEKDPARAFAINATGPRNLARACEQMGAVLVHFSTDYVFDGEKHSPYDERDLPAPLNVYGASKVAGEHGIAGSTRRYFIVRTCGLYGTAGSSGKGGNFVENMLKKAAAGETIRVVDDQILTPTSTLELARTVRELALTEQFGFYHVSCEGQCSWYEFTRRIFALANIPTELLPAHTRDVSSPVRRPPYSVLSKTKLQGLGITMPRWEDALEQYLRLRAAHGTSRRISVLAPENESRVPAAS